MPGHIFTVGHSNHPIEDFLSLLGKHNIEVVVDVRSAPYSKYSTHFNQENLKAALTDAGRKYLYLGAELGGMPKNAAFYDEEGYVLYWKIAASPLFEQGIERLRKGIETYNVALLCGEENPSHCHRRLLVGKVLSNAGVEVLHIRGDGTVQSEQEFDAANSASERQLTLFPETDAPEIWRSTEPVNRTR